MVTDTQVRLLRRKLMEGKTVIAAAAAAGMSERTARTWKDGRLPSAAKRPRWWRTRPDPFSESWEKEVVPLLEKDEEGILEARTILGVLEASRPGRYGESQLRTLQRRMRQWRALYGPEKEAFFPQEHVPGRECAFDFTHATDLGVSVRGELFEHLLFECVLSFSGWTYARLAFSETYEALTCGLQEALWALGGCPEVARSDNLSAATHELRSARGRTLTARYRGLLEHYGMRSTRIRPGEAHENGVVEQRHYRTKSAAGAGPRDPRRQGLREPRGVRGLRAEGAGGVESTARGEAGDRAAAPAAAALFGGARPHDLPSPRDVLEHGAGGRADLLGAFAADRSRGGGAAAPRHGRAVLLGASSWRRMPRIRGDKTARIDYRHVIWSLVRKPGAFARYRFREELFPTVVFRRAYDALRARTERADVEYVRILHLAASTMESKVEAALLRAARDGRRLRLRAGEGAHLTRSRRRSRRCRSARWTCSQYDRLLEGVA